MSTAHYAAEDTNSHHTEPLWHRLEVRAMGAGCQLLAWSAQADPFAWALDELARMEHAWSRFRADSELSYLNNHAGKTVRCSALLRLAVERAIDMWYRTGGLFDPTIHDALVAWGYDATFDVVRGRADTHPVVTVASPGANQIEVDNNVGTIAMPPWVHLDLGGIGKGLAADLLAEGLLHRGATSVCVGMGGDVRSGGVGPDDGGWDIDVTDPDHHEPEAAPTVMLAHLRGDAVACSTTSYRRWRCGTEMAHHLIDPRTGTPADRRMTSAIVQAPTTAEAESWAKAAIIAGPQHGSSLLADAGLKGWGRLDDGQLIELGVSNRSEAPCLR